MSEPTFEGLPEDPTPLPGDQETGTYAGGQAGTPEHSGDEVPSPEPVDPGTPEAGTDRPDPGTDDGSQDPAGGNVPV